MGHRSFREADHLPKRRPSGLPADPAGLPRQRRGVTPQLHGRFPDYDVLANADHWDPVTREVVLARLEAPELRFFSRREQACLRAFLDVALAQDADPRIPLLEMVDAKLFEGRLEGYQYEDLPDDRELWRLVARGLDEAARQLGALDLATAEPATQHAVVERFAAGELSGGVWDELDVPRVWSVVMGAALGEFYAHPWAWNEIGFGGPAYPRGYMRLHIGPAGREPYEAEEAFAVDPVQDLDRQGPG